MQPVSHRSMANFVEAAPNGLGNERLRSTHIIPRGTISPLKRVTTQKIHLILGLRKGAIYPERQMCG